MTKPLVIGIITDASVTLPAWEYAMVEELLTASLAEVWVVVMPAPVPVARESWGLRLFRRFERWWFREGEDAFDLKSLQPLIHQWKLSCIGAGALKAGSGIDILYKSYQFGSVTRLPVQPRYGVWQIVFGIGIYKGNACAAFWEAMRHDPVTGSELVTTLSSGEELVLYEGKTRTVPFSVTHNFQAIAWRSASYLPYRIRTLKTQGAELFFERYGKRISERPAREIPMPGSLQVAGLFIRNNTRYLWNKLISKDACSRFTLLYTRQPQAFARFRIDDFNSLPLPRGRLWADPFVIERGHLCYVFFEEYVEAKEKAHIALIIIDAQTGAVSEPTVVLEQPYHLSYPFVFEWEGAFYMIPETGMHRTVDLYKANRFPYDWEKVHTLMEDVFLVDATLLYHHDKWWLFGCTHNHATTSTNDQLVVYYSDDLFSTHWIPHPQNPVATDISNCRPAGRFIEQEGKLYRPAQDNAAFQYGYALKLNEIERLDENSFCEKEVACISPASQGALQAIHTWNAGERLVVIDAILRHSKNH